MIEKKKRDIYIYIHNLNFDGLLILSSISKQNLFKLSPPPFMRDLSIYSLHIKYESYTIIFKCSYKIIPSSLKKLAEDFNTKEKMIFPYKFSSEKNLNYVGEKPDSSYFNSVEEWKSFPEYFDYMKYSIEYCTRDVEITKKIVETIDNMISVYKLNINKVFSAPSLSLEIFIKKYNNNKIKFTHSYIYDEFIRKSYYGGLCLVYGNPKKNENIYHYDFPGMYGTIMREKFPIGKYIIKYYKKEYNYYNINNLEIGFHKIETEVNNEYPILPHHRLSDKKLMFTNGKISGYYWFEEIIKYIQQDLKNKVIIHESLIFEKYEECFTDFIDFFDKIREKGGEHKKFAKLIVNSLYGRMGMKNEKEKTIFLEKKNQFLIDQTETISIKELNNIIMIKVEINKKNKKMFNIEDDANIKKNIAIASSITSKARIKLINAQEEVLKNGGRLLYSDTDSIFAAFEKDVSNKDFKIIKWELENALNRPIDAVFTSPKSYALKFLNNESIKIKGYIEKNIRFDDFKKNFYEEIDIIDKNFNYLERRNMKLVERITDKKINMNTYDKRKFTKDKKNTEPFFLKDFNYE